MSEVLVTGANGQLGRCIRDLKDIDDNINFTFTSSKELDITNKELVDNYFNNGNFDYCINCAAYTAVDRAEEEQDKAFLVNAEAVKYLATACKENNVTLIHISTDFVFDGEKGEPYVEEDEPNPINVYGASKLKGEQYIQEILEKFFIIRTSWVYSEYGNNFVKTMLKLAKERDEISIVDDQIGSPTYAGDLAEFLVNLIKNNEKKYGIYHYSNKGEISWYEFAKEIFRLVNESIEVNKINTLGYPTLAKRPKYSVLDNTKINIQYGINILNWKEESLKRTLLVLKTEDS